MHISNGSVELGIKMIVALTGSALFYPERQRLEPFREAQQAVGDLMVGRGLNHRTKSLGTSAQILRPTGRGSFGRDHAALTIIDFCQRTIVTRFCPTSMSAPRINGRLIPLFFPTFRSFVGSPFQRQSRLRGA
jgi:hypothetical protein